MFVGETRNQSGPGSFWVIEEDGATWNVMVGAWRSDLDCFFHVQLII